MWKVLPVFLVRSAGFAFELLADLRMPDSSLLADQAAQCELRVSDLQAEFRERIFPQILDAEQTNGAQPEVFREWYRLDRDVRHRRPVAQERMAPLAARFGGLADWVCAWNRSQADLAATLAAFQRDFESELTSARARLRETVAGPRFSEALFLSNPNIYSIALPAYDDQYRSGRRNSKLKYLERQLYGYLQRFCSKNDTASFFGPIDYGSFDGETFQGLVLLHNCQGSPSRRLTRLSYWAAQELARALAREDDVKPFMAPRLEDGCAILQSGELLIALQNRRKRLPEAVVSALRLVDGERTIAELGDVEAAIPKGLLTTEILIPTAEFDPLAWLREWVAALPEACASRLTWLARIDGLLARLDAFPGLALAEKAAELESIERCFFAWTGVDPKRGAGETYADRLVLYDEAQGDLRSCMAGAPIERDLLRALAPVLDLCASYCVVLQRVCQERAIRVFEALGSGGSVPYLAFVRAVNSAVKIADCIADPAVQEYLEGLRALARGSLGRDGVVRIGEAALAPFRHEIPAGTLVSPDVLFRAADAAEIDEGRHQIVIGEIHHGAQVWSHFLALRPDWTAVGRELELLLAEPQSGQRADIVYSRNQGKVFSLELPGFTIEMRGRSKKGHDLILNAAELMVSRGPDGVLTLTHENKKLELYPGDPRAISNWIFGAPPAVAPPIEFGDFTPRIEIGGVVFQRASWIATSREWICNPPLTANLMLHTAMLRSRYGMPARGFVRVPGERKPFYVDFESALSLEYLVSAIRDSATFRFSEMLPDEGDLWLTCPEGHRTCEWRTTFVYSESR